MKKDSTSQKNNEKIKQKILRRFKRFFAVIGLFFLIYHLGFQITIITTGSMSPTLQNGDWILTERVSYFFRSPKRFEVVSFWNEDGMNIMKRIVGFPQEKISLNEEGWLVINGKPISRPKSLHFIEYRPCGNIEKGTQACFDKGYYILGDDSKDSLDSRFEGPLKKKEIVGRAWLVLWPLSRFGFVTS